MKFVAACSLACIFLATYINEPVFAGAACAPDGHGGHTPLPNDCCTTPAGIIDQCPSGQFGRRDPAVPANCTCVSASTELTDLLSIVNGIMIPITVIAGMFLIILAGYKILTSQGNPQELQTGKENLTSAIIGLIFVLMAVSILRVIIKALITGDTDPF